MVTDVEGSRAWEKVGMVSDVRSGSFRHSNTVPQEDRLGRYADKRGNRVVTQEPRKTDLHWSVRRFKVLGEKGAVASQGLYAIARPHVSQSFYSTLYIGT